MVQTQAVAPWNPKCLKTEQEKFSYGYFKRAFTTRFGRLNAPTKHTD
jgi:hypothetical protein